MAQMVSFAGRKRKEQDTADGLRQMLMRVSQQPEKSLDEIKEDFLAEMDVLDPDAAKWMRESISRAGNAQVGRMRAMGYDISGTEFEIRRDHKDMQREAELDRKISSRCRAGL